MSNDKAIAEIQNFTFSPLYFELKKEIWGLKQERTDKIVAMLRDKVRFQKEEYLKQLDDIVAKYDKEDKEIYQSYLWSRSMIISNSIFLLQLITKIIED